MTVQTTQSMRALTESIRTRAVEAPAKGAAVTAAEAVVSPATIEATGLRTITAERERLTPDLVLTGLLGLTLWLVGALTAIGMLSAS